MSGEMNEPSAREQRVNEAIAAYLEAVDAGETPDPKGFIAAHNDIAAELNSFFANRDEFERMAEPLQPAGGAAAPQAQHDEVTLPPAGEPTEAPTLAPTETTGAAIGTMVRYFGDYELLEEIARGGMGVVYMARQINLNRTVALKMILAGQLASEDDVRRFYTEAEAAANLDHPGIVPIFEVGEHEGQHYFSMGFVEGESLADRLKDGPLPPREAAEYTKKITEAIAFAHEQGVIHRDLKPANVLLDRDDQPKVTDFGLAKKTEGDSNLTGTGQILGTPSYMPPEQASGKVAEVTELADVYSLGAILYALVTGRPPFQADNPLDTLMQVLEREPVSPRTLNPTVPQDLETICLKCLEKDRHRRYASAEELAEEFQRFLDGKPIHARPISAPARAWRWCKRRPVIAALSAAVVVSLVAGTSISTYFAIEANRRAGSEAEQRGLAEKREKEAVDAKRSETRARQDAEAARDEAKEESRRAYRSYYAGQMSLAQRDWGDAAIEQLLGRLKQTQPEYTGSEDLRGFEWFYLDRLCHSELLILNDDAQNPKLVNRVAFSPDGSRIASAGSNMTAKVWDAATGEELLAMQRHTGSVNDLAFSPDGHRIASASIELIVWDATSGEELLALGRARRTFESVAFSPDGERIVSCDGGSVQVWNAATGQLQTTYSGHTHVATTLAFSPNGRHIASGTESGDLTVWDASTGADVLNLDEDNRHGVHGVTFSPDGRRLAYACSDRTVKVWDAVTGQRLREFNEPSSDVVFSPDGTRMATAGTMVKVWDAVTGQLLNTLRGHVGVRSVAFSPDGRRIATGGLEYGAIKVWDARMPQEAVPVSFGDPLAFSPDGQRIVSGRPPKVRDFATGQELLTIAGRHDSTVSVAFSPGGGRIASGCRLLKVWNAATGEELLTIDDRSTAPTARHVAFSPDGRWIAGVDGLDRIRLWDAWTGRESGCLRGGGDGNVAFSPDGRRIARGGGRGVIVWDLGTAQSALTLRASQVACVAYSPDGRHIAAASDTNKVKVWDANTGGELLLLEGHTGKISDVVFSPDGQRLASGDERTVRLWDVERGNELLTFQGTTTFWYYPSLAFSPDGRQLVTASQVWDADVTPESKLRRQAISVLRFLFDKPLRKQDVVGLLQTDVSISEEVREQAKVFLHRYHEENDPGRYDEAAWAVVRQPHLCDTQYDFALRQTNAAVALGGEKANYLLTRGAAQFRAGQYEEALTTLTQSIELDNDQPFALVFLALTQHRLGNMDEARQLLGQFRQIVSGQPLSDNVDAQNLLLEAGASIAAEGVETRPDEPGSSQSLE